MMAKKEKPQRFISVKGTVESFISDGFGEITAVGEELREAYDNAPENLKGTSVNETRESTASEIEGLYEPSISNSILGELECTATIDKGKVYRGRMSQSRACRASNGAGMLRAAADAMQEWVENNPPLEDADQNDAAALKARADALAALEEKSIDPDEYAAAHEEAERLITELNDAADTVDNLEFPGMFG